MNRRGFVFGLMGMTAVAQESGLAGPVLGYSLDTEHHVRPLIGPAGSAYLAQPLSGEVALRDWTGSYGLDTEGQLLYGLGTQELRRVETEGGWGMVVGSPRPSVAVVQRDSRIAVARDGAAGAVLDLGMTPTALAVAGDGALIAAADTDRCGLWRPEGEQLLQTSIAGVRALQVLPDNAGLCGLAERFFLIDQMGRREEFADARGSALGLTADGSTVVVLDGESMEVRVFDRLTREWAEEPIPCAADRITPLRDGRTFLISSEAGESVWTLALRGTAMQWAQIPLVRGGRN